MNWQGARRAKVLKTPEDVLEHSYGRSGSSSPEPAAPAPSDPPHEEEMTEEEYADHLVETMKKDELVALAESLGLESDGNKPDIAARIAAHEYSEE